MLGCVVFKQKTAYEMRISDWSSDVCSSDLQRSHQRGHQLAYRLALRLRQAEEGIDHRAVLGTHRLRQAAAPSSTRCLPPKRSTCGSTPDRPEIGRASCRGRVCQYV